MPLSNSLIAVVGAGRLGTLLAAKLDAGPPRGRGATCQDADIVLLCVPDDEIGNAAALIQPHPGLRVGHCSGATTLDPILACGHEAFSVHPLMTITQEGAQLEGAWAAIAGSTPDAARTATGLAMRLGMRPFEVDDADRTAYHASASVASNFLVTLEAFAERLGTDREALAPLVRATVENWAAVGPERALTGPVARGDRGTVARQREAVLERTPELVDLFDALVTATEEVAGRGAVKS
jgi:predicted short-subunit dehydrogenase-like oxidoreductase (DUF2520 family)